MRWWSVFLLMIGCASDFPAGEPCTHGEILREATFTPGHIDLLLLVDHNSVAPEAIAAPLTDLLATELGLEGVHEVFAGVVDSDPCSAQLGELVSACGGPALLRSSTLHGTHGALVERAVCRATSAATSCPWDPASALTRAMEAHDLPREDHILLLILVTAGDAPEMPELDARHALVSLVAGLDTEGAPVGCVGDSLSASPPLRLEAWGREQEERGRSFRTASICEPGWDGALHGRTTPCICVPATCLGRMPLVRDGEAVCEILEELSEDAPVSRCTDLPGRERVEYGNNRLCRIRQRRDAPGWFLRETPDPSACGSDPAQLEITVEPVAGSHLTLRCQTLGDLECSGAP